MKRIWEENNEIYLDLFDDEFYDLDTLLAGKGHERRLANIKLHLLLWMVLGKTVVVPEQWALSSRLCQQVINEIADSFLRYLKNSDYHGMRYPIRIQSLTRAQPENFQHHALEGGLMDRLKNKRRLRLDHALDIEINGSAEVVRDSLNNTIKRASVRELIRGELDFSLMREKVHDEFLKDLTSCGVAKDIRSDTIDLLSGTLVFHSAVRDSGRFKLYSPYRNVLQSTQESAIANYVEAVHWVVFNTEYSSSDDDRVKAIQSMFVEADRKNMPRSSIMSMWKIIGTFDADIRIFIERLGRLCLHGAISEQYHVAYGTNGMAGGLDLREFDDFEKGLQERVRDRLTRQEFGIGPESCDALTLVPNYLTLEDNPKNDVFDFSRVSWETIWYELWDYLYAPEWEKSREKLSKDLERAMRSSPEDCSAEWDRIFATICNRFSMIQFKRSVEHSAIGVFTITAVEEADNLIRTTDSEPTFHDFSSLTENISLALNLPSFFHFLSRVPKLVDELKQAGEALRETRIFEKRDSTKIGSMKTLGSEIR